MTYWGYNEKGKIRGRYTIFGKNPDKIWEFNNKNSYLTTNNIKKKITNKRFISMANPYEVKTQTGYTIGSVSPVGHLKLPIKYNQLV